MPGWKPITFPDVVFTECISTADSGSCHVKVRVHTLPSSTYHTHKCSTCLTTWAGVFVVEWNCSPAPRLTTIKLNHGSREVRPTILSHKTWPFSLRATTPNTLHILAAFFFCFFLSSVKVDLISLTLFCTRHARYRHWQFLLRVCPSLHLSSSHVDDGKRAEMM